MIADKLEDEGNGKVLNAAERHLKKAAKFKNDAF